MNKAEKDTRMLVGHLHRILQDTRFDGPISQRGDTILIDIPDEDAPDGNGRTYFLTLREVER